MIHEIIIIGGGISGLYSFYRIKELYENLNKEKDEDKDNKIDIKCILLEKNNRLGGRAGNYNFHGSNVVIGAGILRKNKDKLLINLAKKFNIPLNEFTVNINHAKNIKNIIPIIKTINKLKKNLNKLTYKKKRYFTFKKYFISIFGKKIYEDFKKSAEFFK
jgi:monoamine oxidase